MIVVIPGLLEMGDVAKSTVGGSEELRARDKVWWSEPGTVGATEVWLRADIGYIGRRGAYCSEFGGLRWVWNECFRSIEMMIKCPSI